VKHRPTRVAGKEIRDDLAEGLRVQALVNLCAAVSVGRQDSARILRSTPHMLERYLTLLLSADFLRPQWSGPPGPKTREWHDLHTLRAALRQDGRGVQAAYVGNSVVHILLGCGHAARHVSFCRHACWCWTVVAGVQALKEGLPREGGTYHKSTARSANLHLEEYWEVTPRTLARSSAVVSSTQSSTMAQMFAVNDLDVPKVAVHVRRGAGPAWRDPPSARLSIAARKSRARRT